METSSSPQRAPAKPRDRDDDASEPVRDSRTSDRFALLWTAIMVLSFLVTLAILFWAASRIA